MSVEKLIHVELPGHGAFWVSDAVLRGEDHGSLIPEDHVADGAFNLFTMFSSDSYAHCFPDSRGILRYHAKIGEISDLRPIDRIAVVPAAFSGDPGESTR